MRGRALRGHSGFQAANHRQPPQLAPRQNIALSRRGLSANRYSQIVRTAHLHPEEARGSDTHNLVGVIVHREGISHDAGISSILALPEPVTDHGYGRAAAGTVVGSIDQTSDNRHNFQSGEEIAADKEAFRVARFAPLR